jgi:hypothetical protein
MWEEHRITYYNCITRWRAVNPLARAGTRFRDFPPTVEEWVCRKEGVPNGEAFRLFFREAHYRPGGAGQDSRQNYYTRYLQQIIPMQSISEDHTHDAKKNFDVPTAGKIWNATTESFAPATMVLT